MRALLKREAFKAHLMSAGERPQRCVQYEAVGERHLFCDSAREAADYVSQVAAKPRRKGTRFLVVNGLPLVKQAIGDGAVPMGLEHYSCVMTLQVHLEPGRPTAIRTRAEEALGWTGTHQHYHASPLLAAASDATQASCGSDLCIVVDAVGPRGGDGEPIMYIRHCEAIAEELGSFARANAFEVGSAHVVIRCDVPMVCDCIAQRFRACCTEVFAPPLSLAGFYAHFDECCEQGSTTHKAWKRRVGYAKYRAALHSHAVRYGTDTDTLRLYLEAQPNKFVYAAADKLLLDQATLRETEFLRDVALAGPRGYPCTSDDDIWLSMQFLEACGKASGLLRRVGTEVGKMTPKKVAICKYAIAHALVAESFSSSSSPAARSKGGGGGDPEGREHSVATLRGRVRLEQLMADVGWLQET